MKFIRLLLVLCALSAYNTSLFSQENTTKVFYQDGSIFIGRVISEDNDFMKLVIITGDTIALNKNLILQRPRKVKGPRFHYESGPFAAFNLGVASDAQLDLLLGYRVNNKYSVGIGTGLHPYYTTINGEFTDKLFIPIYGYGRKYLSDKGNIRPWLALSAGYSIGVEDPWLFDDHDYNGGPMLEPAFGVTFNSRGKFRLTLSLAQNFQYSEGNFSRLDFIGNPIEADYSVWHTRTVFKIGIEFR